MSDLIAYAKRELRHLPGARSDERKMLNADVLALIAVFQSQKHSGRSARFVTECFDKLVRWQPLLPDADRTRPSRVKR